MLQDSKIDSILSSVSPKKIRHNTQRALLKMLKAKGEWIPGKKLGVARPKKVVENLRHCKLPVQCEVFRGTESWYRLNTNRCSEKSVGRVLGSAQKQSTSSRG